MCKFAIRANIAFFVPKLKAVRNTFVALALSLLPLTGAAATGTPLIHPEITGPRETAALGECVAALCDPTFAGRAAGTGSALAAAQEIARRFTDAGIAPFGGSYLSPFEWKGKSLNNVVGCIPGTSGKWVVVGAYYDGLGTLDGRIFAGADANASGVAALLALAAGAHRFCPDPADGIIFAAFDGHNCDYAGARNLLKKLGARNIRMMISLDTIGSSLAPVQKRKPNYLIALGAEKYRDKLTRCAKGTGLNIYYDYYRSEDFTNLFYRKIGDQRVFLEAGVPSIVFTSGITMNTQKDTDTPSALDYAALKARIDVISRFLLSRIKKSE